MTLTIGTPVAFVEETSRRELTSPRHAPEDSEHVLHDAPLPIQNTAREINSAPVSRVASPRTECFVEDRPRSARPATAAIRRAVGVQRSHVADGDGTACGPGPCSADTWVASR